LKRLSTINSQFTIPRFTCEAPLTAGSYLPDIVGLGDDGNKNLAVVGDAVLRLLLVSDGYDKGLYKDKNNTAERDTQQQITKQ